MPKATYFDSNKFITSVIDAMKLGQTTAPTLLALREEIENLLSDRILATVINGMGQKELQMYTNMLEDHPELDEMDALMVLAPSIDGLREKLERNINSLYAKLTRNAEQVEKKMKLINK